MANSDSTDTSRPADDGSDEDEGDMEAYNSQLAASRNGSSTNLRARSTGNENIMAQQPSIASVQASYRQQTPRFPQQPGGGAPQPPLTLNTSAGFNAMSQSPERNNASYFSPVAETPLTSIGSMDTPLTSRTSSSSSQYPFPRQLTPNYYPDDPNRYTPPNMSRTPSREGSSTPNQLGYQSSQRLQRPSLPGMSGPIGGGGGGGNTAASLQQQQQRMRSASTPNIHHVPTAQQLARSPGGPIPPIPSVPTPYVAYNGGPAVINRSPNNSPTSPNLPIQGSRTASPAIQPQPLQDLSRLNGSAITPSVTPVNGSRMPQQVKVKIQCNNDKLIIIVPYGIAYSQLMDRIERKVRLCGNGNEISPSTPIRIRYQDEDGDFISMNSDDDVQMAFDASCEPGQNDGAGTCGAVTLFVQVG